MGPAHLLSPLKVFLPGLSSFLQTLLRDLQSGVTLLRCSSVEYILFTVFLGYYLSPHQAELQGDGDHINLQGHSPGNSPSLVHRGHSGHEKWMDQSLSTPEKDRKDLGAGLRPGQAPKSKANDDNHCLHTRTPAGTCSGVSGWLKAGVLALARSVTHYWRHKVTLKVKHPPKAMLCPGWEPGTEHRREWKL